MLARFYAPSLSNELHRGHRADLRLYISEASLKRQLKSRTALVIAHDENNSSMFGNRYDATKSPTHIHTYRQKQTYTLPSLTMLVHENSNEMALTTRATENRECLNSYNCNECKRDSGTSR
ncbi:hypothetical protein CBL_05307 [Carabus blaptoides fortunei]